ncbi:MAG: CopG family ribbon-helix-helix protein [Rhizobiaceae bacterium]
MTSKTFSMRMDSDTKKKLEEEAARMERSASWVAQKAIQDYLAREEALKQSLRAAIAEADKGVFVSGEAVERWMDRWADGFDDPFPEPDVFPDQKAKKIA